MILNKTHCKATIGNQMQEHEWWNHQLNNTNTFKIYNAWRPWTNHSEFLDVVVKSLYHQRHEEPHGQDAKGRNKFPRVKVARSNLGTLGIFIKLSEPNTIFIIHTSTANCGWKHWTGITTVNFSNAKLHVVLEWIFIKKISRTYISAG